MPPERAMPTGTSLTKRRRVASVSSSVRRSLASPYEPVKDGTLTGG